MPSFWRLIESPPSDIFSEMNLDRELFEAFFKNPEATPILRIYRVREPAMTIGRSYQSAVLEGDRSPFCVRPTGGGLVRHGNDLIYSVIARRNSFSTFRQVRTSYLSFHEAVQEAFQKLGIETRLFRSDDSRARANSKRKPSLDDCFRRPVPTDVAVEDQKIAGGAQWRRGEAFLHQGSIQLAKGIFFPALRQAFVEVFERKFGIVWEPRVPMAAGV